MNRKLLSTILTAIFLCVMMVPGALADTEDFTITGGSLTSTAVGDLTFAEDGNGTTITLGSDIVFEADQTDFAILDPTGTNSGWICGFSMSDFYSEGSIDNPTSPNAFDILDVYISADDWVTFTLSDGDGAITADADADPFVSKAYTAHPDSVGADIAAANITIDMSSFTGGANQDTTSTTDIDMVEVEPGYGAGAYVFDFNFQVTIDEWLPEGTIIDGRNINAVPAATTADDATTGAEINTRFNYMNTVMAADKVQVFAGTYTSNFTYSIQSNPAS